MSRIHPSSAAPLLVQGIDQHPALRFVQCTKGHLPSSFDGCSKVSDEDAAIFFLDIPAGFSCKQPIRFVVSAPCTTHVCIHVGAGSVVTMMEELRSFPSRPSDEHGVFFHTVEIIVDEGAQVEYMSLQCVDASLRSRIRHRSVIERDARMYWRTVSLGASEVEHDLLSHVVGARAESSVDWTFYAKGRERQNLRAHNIFDAAGGRGEITLRGVAENKAHVVCRGMIEIGGGGGGTDTYLTEEVLMLDATAKVDAVPGLEIKTNDVKASHSATVSRVTPEDLFYFAARGIDMSVARSMFIEGFLLALLEKLSDAELVSLARREIALKYRQS